MNTTGKLLRTETFTDEEGPILSEAQGPRFTTVAKADGSRLGQPVARTEVTNGRFMWNITVKSFELLIVMFNSQLLMYFYESFLIIVGGQDEKALQEHYSYIGYDIFIYIFGKIRSLGSVANSGRWLWNITVNSFK